MGWHQILGLICFLVSLHSSLSFASSPLCPPDQRDALLHFRDSFVLNEKFLDPFDSCVSARRKGGCYNSSRLGIRGSSSRNSFVLNEKLLDPIDSSVSAPRKNGCYYSSRLGIGGSYASCPREKSSSSSCTRERSSSSSCVMERSFSSWNESVDCCLWSRVTCEYGTGNVIGLTLSSIQFHGALYSNSSLLLPKLQMLTMSNCNLTKFPYFLNSLERLTHLDLSSNKISGEIPMWFWGISHHALEQLDLSDNLLEGGIHPCFCNITKLLSLDLSNNGLLGNIPPCFGTIINLEHLDLSSNKLQGSLPRSLVKCANLFELVLSHNEFDDIFPHWLEAPQLHHLDLQSNKFHGRINPTAFGLSFPALTYLYISNNSFTGRCPAEVFSNTSLIAIDLSNNQFGGPLPLPSPITIYYSIASNNIAGEIPFLICNATKLQMIDLSNNSLTGCLPQCLTNFTNLSILNLRMNQLEGTIPQSISLIDGLTTLDLSQNRFEGTLPQSLVECTNLEILDLSSNQIEDTFPRWLGKLPELKVLILRSNNFKGLVNISKGDLLFPQLRILDLSNNNFGGPLPANLIMNLTGIMNSEDCQDKPSYMTWQCFSSGPSYENTVTVMMKGQKTKLVKILTIFTTIDLSHNSFQGDIPGVIGHLHSLIGLNLSHNNLTGSIPLTLGNLIDLGWLDLSWNMLSGVIPSKLGDLTSLGYLNLSKNQLTGRIPQDKQLSTFSNDSFSGNPGLCGFPLTKACPGHAGPTPPSPSSTLDRKGHESWFTQKVVLIGYASGIVIGISTAYISFEIGRPKWLALGVRKLERRAARWMKKKSKQKAIKFQGQ